MTIDDEREFQEAMGRYRHASGRAFPTWSEVLEVLHTLGYAKRVWKPVASWAPLDHSAGDPSSPACWFATVETSMTP